MMRLTALAGGVGAAKLLYGLIKVMPAEDMSIVVNTGDDFQWHGLQICPDIDTVTYTLAGMDNPAAGWGIRGDSFRCLEALSGLGSETWFQIGDVDLATHIYRSHAIGLGATLSAVTEAIAKARGIKARIFPMTDSAVPTLVHIAEGILPFQEYFVRRRCAPEVRAFSFQNIERAKPAPGVLEAIQCADVVLICPSNPYISIGPILSVPGIRASLGASPAVKVAVTPIVGGRALKGPAGDMMRQLGEPVSPATVAALYRDFLDVFVLDRRDSELRAPITATGLEVRVVDTVMSSTDARIALARSILEML